MQPKLGLWDGTYSDWGPTVSPYEAMVTLCRYRYIAAMAGYTGRNILIVVDNSAVRYQASRNSDHRLKVSDEAVPWFVVLSVTCDGNANTRDAQGAS